MRIGGELAHLRRREQRLLGCGPDESIGRIDKLGPVVVDTVLAEAQRASELPCFDSTSGMVVALEARRARRHMDIAADVIGPALVHQIESHFKIPHEPAVPQDRL